MQELGGDPVGAETSAVAAIFTLARLAYGAFLLRIPISSGPWGDILMNHSDILSKAHPGHQLGTASRTGGTWKCTDSRGGRATARNSGKDTEH
jgi:hypothetical protein